MLMSSSFRPNALMVDAAEGIIELMEGDLGHVVVGLPRQFRAPKVRRAPIDTALRVPRVEFCNDSP